MNQVSLLLSNARSVKGKISELQALSPFHNIICITETHLDSSYYSGLLFPSGKVVYRKDRDVHGGGVLIAIDSVIPHSLINLNACCEAISINIQLTDFNITLVCYYRPPSQFDISPFLSYVTSLRQLFPSHKLLLMGDFNMPGICWETLSTTGLRPFERDFVDALSKFNLSQIVDSPTHIKGNILDLVCTDLGNIMTNFEVVQPGLSDHYLVSANVLTNTNFASQRKPKVTRIFQNADLPGFQSELAEIHQAVKRNIQGKSSMNEVWNTFKNGLLSAISRNVPSRAVSVKSTNNPPWFTRRASRACATQRRLYKRYKRSGDPAHLAIYKTACKSNRRLFRCMKRQHMNDKLFSPFSEGNSKPFFKYVRSIKGNGNGVHSIQTDSGQLSQDNKVIASTLNKFFQSVFLQPVDFAPPALLDNQHIPTITEQGVLQIIKSLRNGTSPGPDSISKEMLVLDIEKCAMILTDIFNFSISTGSLPDEWKIANVVPIHKQGNRSLPSNYRPISLTCICCKLLEHIIMHNLNIHLEHIIHNNQHGFRKSLSCSTQLITVVHDLASSIDKGIEVHAVVLDFSKAFDRVPHHRLIDKLVRNNVCSYITRWIASFLSDRLQRVVIDDMTSDLVPVTSGVPQGSVLGPALFILYINDIVGSVTNSTIRLFADDTLVYSQITNAKDHQLFQKDLNSLLQWSTQNQMSFNASKSNVIVFTNRPKPAFNHCYSMDDIELSISTCVKYLGVYLQSNLKWTKHIDTITAKAKRLLGLMYHIMHDADSKLKLLAYYSLCRSGLEYAAEVWDPFHRAPCEDLEIFQNKAFRFIFNLKGRVSFTVLRETHCLPTLESRRQDKRISTFCKILDTPSLHPALTSFTDQMSSHRSTLNTRSTALNPVYCKTSCFHNSFMPRTARDIRLKSGCVDQ